MLMLLSLMVVMLLSSMMGHPADNSRRRRLPTEEKNTKPWHSWKWVIGSIISCLVYQEYGKLNNAELNEFESPNPPPLPPVVQNDIFMEAAVPTDDTVITKIVDPACPLEFMVPQPETSSNPETLAKRIYKATDTDVEHADGNSIACMEVSMKTNEDVNKGVFPNHHITQFFDGECTITALLSSILAFDKKKLSQMFKYKKDTYTLKTLKGEWNIGAGMVRFVHAATKSHTHAHEHVAGITKLIVDEMGGVETLMKNGSLAETIVKNIFGWEHTRYESSEFDTIFELIQDKKIIAAVAGTEKHSYSIIGVDNENNENRIIVREPNNWDHDKYDNCEDTLTKSDCEKFVPGDKHNGSTFYLNKSQFSNFFEDVVIAWDIELMEYTLSYDVNFNADKNISYEVEVNKDQAGYVFVDLIDEHTCAELKISQIRGNEEVKKNYFKISADTGKYSINVFDNNPQKGNIKLIFKSDVPIKVTTYRDGEEYGYKIKGKANSVEAMVPPPPAIFVETKDHNEDCVDTRNTFADPNPFDLLADLQE